MIERLAALLDVRREERALVLAVFGYSFVIGLSRIFLVPAQALFLERFDASHLAWSYLASSIASILLGFTYMRASRRLAPSTLVTFNLLAAGTVTATLWAFLYWTDAGWVRFAIAAWNLCGYAFSSLAFWDIARRVFDVRQGKRLFALVSAGDVLAYLLGGFALGPLASLLGTGQLLLISAGASVCAVAVMGVLLRMRPERLRQRAWHEAAARRTPRAATALLGDRYVALITAYVVMSGLSYIFVDNAFNAGVQGWLGKDHTAELAQFFGIYMGATALINLGFRTFLAGRLLARLGLLGGLAALPLVELAGAGLTAGSGILAGSVALTCACATATRMSDKILRGVQNASLATIYQARPGDGTRIQAFMEGVIDSVAFGTAALVLLVARALTHMDAGRMALLAVGVCVVWLGISVALDRRYRVELAGLLGRRRLEIRGQIVLDSGTRRRLLEEVEGPSAEAALYAFDLLEKAEDSAVPSAALALLRRPEPEVRGLAVERAGTLRLRAALPLLRERLESEEDLATRARLVEAISALDPGDPSVGIAHLESGEPALREAAIVGMLRSGSLEGVLHAGGALLPLVHSPDPAARRRAAQLLGRGGVRDLSHPVLQLLGDDDAAVRREALQALRRLAWVGPWEPVLRRLEVPSEAGAAAAALVGGGTGAALAVTRALAEGGLAPAVRARLFRALARMDAPEIDARLFEHVGCDDPEERLEALEALVARRPPVSREVRARLEVALDREANTAAMLLDLCTRCAAWQDADLLASALEEELATVRERILLLLALLTEHAALVDIREQLAGPDATRRAFAVELLDSLLSQPQRARLLPLFDDLSLEERVARLPVRPGTTVASPPEVAALLLSDAEPRVGRWTREVASSLDARQPLGVSAARVRFLKRIDLLAELPGARLLDLAPLFEPRVAEPGSVIVREGEVGDAMYLIESGEVVASQQDVFLRTLGEADLFGEITALVAEPRTATVTARTRARLLRLRQEDLAGLLAYEPRVGRRLVQAIARRLVAPPAAEGTAVA